MKYKIIYIILIFVLFTSFFLWKLSGFDNYSEKQKTPETLENNKIVVYSPKRNEYITSPYRIMGQARGGWYFEASFPIILVDDKGNIVAETKGDAISDWMTTDFVPFHSEIFFETPDTETGFLIFKKDNPSGLIENEEEIKIPIKFKRKEDIQKRRIRLFYYNEKEDIRLSEDGNPSCNIDAILPVEREVSYSITPIEDSIKELLMGKITEEEKKFGFSSELPNHKFNLIDVNLKEGVLILQFNEVPGFTSGGSCRVSILSEQIIKTALQFPEVKKVILKPDGIFQP